MAFTPIPENSAATPGLWNSRFQELNVSFAGIATTSSLSSRIGDVLVSVKDYGAIGNGVADDTAAIRAAILGAPAGATVYFPTGTYNVSSQIDVDRFVRLRGNGAASVTPEGSRISAIAVMDPMFNVTGREAKIEGFYINGPASGSAIYVNGSLPNTVLQDIIINGAGQGVVHDGSFVGEVNRVRVSGSSNGPGFLTRNGSTSINFNACFATSCENGFLFLNARYLTLNGCAADFCGHYGYSIDTRCESIALVGCGSEDNGWAHSRTSGNGIGFYNNFTVRSAKSATTGRVASGLEIDGANTTVIGFVDSTPTSSVTRTCDIQIYSTASNTQIFGGSFSSGIKDSGTGSVLLSAQSMLLNVPLSLQQQPLTSLRTQPSFSSLNLAVNEIGFSLHGSGASLALRSGGTIWYFTSSASTKG